MGTTDANGNPAIGCVENGCCQWSNQIASFCSASNEVCCYSALEPGCSGPGEPGEPGGMSILNTFVAKLPAYRY